MKYKILNREDYVKKSGYRFCVDKREDTNGNVKHCLVVCDIHSEGEICLFESSELITCAQIDQKIKEFLLRRVVDRLWVKTYFCGLKSIKIKQVDDGIKINNKIFKIAADDYDTLCKDATNYIFGNH